jgi:hypothetical protein
LNRVSTNSIQARTPLKLDDPIIDPSRLKWKEDAMVRKAPEPVLPPAAKTLEGREDQLIAAAMDLVERRIAEGSASAQETVHFLKLGSVRNQLEQSKLKAENEMLIARVKDMESRQSSESLYAEALAAFKGYSGQTSLEDADEDVY